MGELKVSGDAGYVLSAKGTYSVRNSDFDFHLPLLSQDS